MLSLIRIYHPVEELEVRNESDFLTYDRDEDPNDSECESDLAVEISSESECSSGDDVTKFKTVPNAEPETPPSSQSGKITSAFTSLAISQTVRKEAEIVMLKKNKPSTPIKSKYNLRSKG